MSFGEPVKESPNDMSRFRRDLRRMWREMQFRYSEGRADFWRVPFPEMKLVGDD